MYGDLKPENILLTESGHAKLTDFGAVRPHTEEARRLVADAHAAVDTLRDGDWRAAAPADAAGGRPGGGSGGGGVLDAESLRAVTEEDGRLEGTTAYLAPELVLESRASVASDCWALGCGHALAQRRGHAAG